MLADDEVWQFDTVILTTQRAETQSLLGKKWNNMNAPYMVQECSAILLDQLSQSHSCHQIILSFQIW